MISQWIASKKPNTERTFLMHMQIFTDWINKTPTELIEEAEAEVENGVLMRKRKIVKYLTDYRKFLEERKLAPLTIKGRVNGVCAFYKHFYIEIPKRPQSTEKAKPLIQHKEIPTKEDLQEVLSHCDKLEKAILLVGVASGLAVAEITELKVSDFKNGYDKETEITTLKLRREKVNYDFITFLTPEASRAVIDYLNYRNRKVKTEQQKRENQLKKQRVTRKDGYLFICRKVPDEFLKKKDESLRKLDEKTIMNMYRQLSEDSQKSSEFGVWNLIRSHNLRKYFNSALKNAGAGNFYVEFWMGHTLDSTQDSYFIPDAEKLKEIYKQYMPYLTIQKELNVVESPEFKKITEELRTAHTEAERHIVERKEITNLKEELEKTRQELEKAKQDIIEADAEIYKGNRLRDAYIDHKIAEGIEEGQKKFRAWLDEALENIGKPEETDAKDG